MTSGDEPEQQGNQQPAPEQEPAEPAENVVENKTYNFISYSEDGETEYAQGTAETTGNTKTFNEAEYVEIEVKTNSEESWVGQKYYIIADANADGETKYDLYDAEGNAIGVKVTVTEAE